MVEHGDFVLGYENSVWLHSPHARVIRIMAEFMEPGDRLKEHGVLGTIVFFGSGRIIAPEQYEIETFLAKSLGKEEFAERISLLERTKSLAKYYPVIMELAKLITGEHQHNLLKHTTCPDWAQTAESASVTARSVENLGSHSAVEYPELEGGRLIVCTNGGLGLLEAANKGATKAKSNGRSIAMSNVGCPLNDFTTPDLSFIYKYFFIRKFWMTYMALGNQMDN